MRVNVVNVLHWVRFPEDKPGITVRMLPTTLGPTGLNVTILTIIPLLFTVILSLS